LQLDKIHLDSYLSFKYTLLIDANWEIMQRKIFGQSHSSLGNIA